MKDIDWDKIFLEKAGSEYSDNSLEYLAKNDPQFLFEFIIKSDKSDYNRAYAVSFLTLGETRKVLGMVIDLAKNNPSDLVRDSAIGSLFIFFEEDLVPKEEIEEIYNDLLKTEKNESIIKGIKECIQEFRYDI